MFTRRLFLVTLAAMSLPLGHSLARAEDEHPVITLVKSKVKDPAKPFALFVTIIFLPEGIKLPERRRKLERGGPIATEARGGQSE